MSPQLPNLINFTVQERSQIAKLSRNNRFMVVNLVEPIYPQETIKQIEFFNKSIRLLTNIKNVCNIIEISNKINSFLDSNKDIIINSLKLEHSYNTKLEYRKHHILLKINNFIIENKEVIFNLIDVILETGKDLKEYDPGETTGFY